MPRQAARLPARGIAPPARQARNVGPKRGCARSQASSRDEDRAKQPAPRIMKIVVGISGTNAPTNPRPTHSKPSSSHPLRMTAPSGKRTAGTSGAARIDPCLHTSEGFQRPFLGTLLLILVQLYRIEREIGRAHV